MEKAAINLKTEIFTKVNMSMDKEQVKVYIIIQMVEFSTEIGKMESVKDKVRLPRKMEQVKVVFGKMKIW